MNWTTAKGLHFVSGDFYALLPPTGMIVLPQRIVLVSLLGAPSDLTPARQIWSMAAIAAVALPAVPKG